MPYINRFLGNANGAITFTGNTFGLSKQNNANAPGTAHAIGTFSSTNPNSIDGSYSLGTTADWRQNSSSAVLRLPTTTTRILYAELIWGGTYSVTGENVSAFINNSITFRTPNGNFTVAPDSATSSTLTTSPNLFYVRSANVTNLVTGAGTYTAVGVPGTQSDADNSLNSAGWTLAVVYEDPLQRSRNLSVFVGAELTSSAGTSTATVSGFGTPVTGNVSGRLLISTIEGDSILTGDQLQFGPTAATLQAVSGPNNPINNFFASQINNDAGTLDTSGTFGNLNHPVGTNISGARQGWDITNIDVSSRLQNNQTSAVVRGTTQGETYVINSLGVQIDINAPIVSVEKTANVSSARTGDIITYTVRAQNTGTADASLVIATDALSNATRFIANSLTINGVQQPNANIQNGISLGTIGINQTITVTYRVQVAGPLTNISQLSNQVFLNYQFQSTPGNTVTGGAASLLNNVTAVNTAPTVPNYTVTNPEDTPAIGQVVGNDVDGNPLTYQLGTVPANGSVSVNPNGQFIYTPRLNFNGTDTFTVIVNDGQGGTATSTVTLIITPVNDAPSTQNYSLETLEDTPLNGRIVATDPDGDVLTFTLQNTPTNGFVNLRADGTYTYTPNLNFNGTDQFSVVVSDGQGGTAVSIVTIAIIAVNDPPTVPDYAFTTQEDASITGAVVGTDVDGNPLTYVLQAQASNGIAVVNANGTFTYTPNPNFNGTDVFTVLVSDGQGGTAISTITINVLAVNDPPVTGNLSFTINEDTLLSNRVTAVDPDGDALTFSLQNPPTNGVVVVNVDGTFTYTPKENFNGTDVFTVLVSDGQGGTAVSTVTITVAAVNDAPTVPNYTFTIAEDGALSGVIVGNDVDGDSLTYRLQAQASNGVAVVNANGTFTYTPNSNFNGTDTFSVLVSDVQGATVLSTVTVNVLAVNDPPVTGNLFFLIEEDTVLTNQVTATDADGDSLTFSLQNAPVNGVVLVNANGTFTYTPNLNFNGTDVFTVLVSDGQGGTAVSTVNITIVPVNDAPTVPDYTFTIQEDSAATGRIVAVDSDGDVLTYTLQTQGANGTAVVNADGTFTYTPNPNFNGTDVFTVLVSDGQGGTAVSTVTITVLPVNDPPVTGNLFFLMAEDTVLTNQVTATDVDGDALTFSLQNTPVNGVVVVNANGTFTYTPNLNFNGTDVFTVLVSDGQGGTAVSTVNITISPVNDAPTVPDYTFTIQEDNAAIGRVVAVDPDGDVLTYTLQTQGANGVAIVNTDGTFTYTPNLNFNGTDVFTVLVSDGQGATAVSTVTITVLPVNDPPVTGNLFFLLEEDTILTNQVTATDADGDALTFSLQNAPVNGVVVVNADGTFTYTPNLNFNGTDVFTVLVSDGQGGTAVSTVTITVTAINDAPTVPDYTFTIAEDNEISGVIVGNDVDGDPLTYTLQTQAANGVAVVNIDGAFTYTPTQNFNGTDMFTVLVSDGQGGTAASTVTVNVLSVNDSPVTGNLFFLIGEDTVLANQITATDVDGDFLTFGLQNNPVNGVAVVNVDGTFTYTPNSNFNGTDAFTVLVSDGQGGTAVSTVTITVTAVNDAPTVPDYTFTIQEDGEINAVIVGSDVDGDSLTYTLQTQATNGVAVVNADGTFTYTPNLNFNGTDAFTVLVSDGQGATAVSTVTVNVLAVNDLPVTGNLFFLLEEDTILTNQVTATDADGDALTFSLQNGPINGAAVVNADGTFTYTPNLNFNGTDAFTVLVSDGQGGTAVSTINITIAPVNDAPTVPNYTFTIQEDSVATGSVVAVDPDGDVLTYSLQTQGANGVAVVNADGTFTYTPNLNFNGTDAFTVLVSDGQGATAVSTVTVNVLAVNDPPVTGNLFFLIAEDAVLTNQVTATDADGDPLTFSLQNAPVNGIVVVNVDGTFTYTPNLNFNGTDAFTVLVSDGQGGTAVSTVNIAIAPVNDAPTVPDYTFTIQEDNVAIGSVVAIDLDGDVLTYSLQAQGANGVTVVNADGTFAYTPNENFNGTDVFTVLVSDGQGGTAVSTVTITVLPVNDPPVTGNLFFLIAEDTALTNQVTATDADGDALTFSLQNGPINGASVVNSDGTFTYTPNLNFNGTDAFTVLVSDGQGGTAVSTITITIAPVNDAPTVPNYTFITEEDDVLIGVIVGNDVDGDFLTYSLQTQAGNGVVVVNPDGTFTYTPNPNFNGTDTFTVLVSDGQGGTAVSTVIVNVEAINDPPVTANLVFTIAEDTFLFNQIPGTDPDGDALTFTLLNAPRNGNALVNLNGTFTYIPAANYNGNDVFTVLVSDNQGGTAVSSVFVTIVPVNDPPIVNNRTVTTTINIAVISSVPASDIEGDSLTYTVDQIPANGIVVLNVDGVFTYTPNLDFIGDDVFTVLVTDSQGASGLSTITVDVLATNGTTVAFASQLTTPEDIPVQGQINATNTLGNPLFYTVQNPPTFGTVILNSATGAYTYTPDQNYNGNDSFTVFVTDNLGGNAASSQIITVTSVNDAPVVPNYQLTTLEDTPVSSEVIATDVDGNLLVYSLLIEPANGTAIVESTGVYTYIPSLNFNGLDSFTVLVDDGQGGTATSIITVTITPVNDPPVGPNELTFIVAEDAILAGQVIATDPDGDILAYTLQTQAVNGVAVVNADGTFTYTPNANYNGMDSFTVRISDPSGVFIITTIMVTVTPVNDSPIVPNYGFEINEDTVLNSVVIGSDIDGDPLTYALQTQATNGVAAVNLDGTFTYTPNVNFNGIDVFTVLVSDNQGGTAISTVTVTVTSVNDAPIAPSLITITTVEDMSVGSIINATDPDGDALTFTIESAPISGTAVINADGTFTYTPNLNFTGADAFTVRVADPSGAFVIVNVQVTVSPVNDAPIAPNYQFMLNEDTILTSRVIGTDVDGDVLTYALQTQAGSGVAVVNADGTFTYTPNVNFNGIDAFTVLVSDNQGGTAISTVTVTVTPVNDAPIAPSLITITTAEDTLVGSVINATDPDGDALTFTVESAPVNGTALANADGTFTYIPNLNFTGTDTFTIRVADPSGAFAIVNVQVTVSPVNDAPVVPNYQFTLNEDTVLTSRVIGTDVDGGVLTYVLQIQAANGVAVVNADGTFTYTPNANFNGTDFFTVLVSDNQGETVVSTITVTVTPVNDAPVAPFLITITTAEDTPVGNIVNATDPDGDALTFTIESTPTSGTAVINADSTFTYTPNLNFTGMDTFTIRVADPSGAFVIVNVQVTVSPVNDAPTVPNYQFTLNEEAILTSRVIGTDVDGDVLTYVLQTQAANGVAVVNADGTFAYTPNSNFNGTDVFTVLVSDNQGETVVSTITVTVIPVNDAPIAPSLITIMTAEDTLVGSTINATDPDGDVLAFTIESAPTNGTAVVNTDGTFTYTPNLNYNGMDSFAVRISDPSDAFIITTIMVTVIPVNDPPVVPNYSFTINEDTVLNNVIIGSDIDGDVLTYSLQTQATSGIAVVNVDGTFSYTPNANFNGVDQFIVLVSDAQGATAVSTVNITVTPVNDAPIAPSLIIITTAEDTPVGSVINATDPDGEGITFVIENAPTNGTAVVNADGTFTYTPNLNFTGTDSFSVRVADESGGFVIVNIQVVVAPENDAPVVPNYEFTTAEDTVLTSRVIGTDADGDVLTYALQTQAGNGVAVVNGDGTFTYTPNANFNGIDVFTVLVSDNQGGTALSTITITVTPVNDAPIAPSLIIITTAEDTPVGSVINATDPDEDALTFIIENAPINGTAVVNADGTFTYTPNLNFTGTDAFSVRVADASGGFVIVSIQVGVVPENDAPVVPNYEFTTAEDTVLTSRVIGTDVDGDVLTYALQTQAGNGVAVVNGDGTFTYTPNANFNGIDVFTVLVSDDQGGTALSTITIIVTPVNDAPIAPSLITITTSEDTPVGSVINATDPDGDALTFTIENAPINGTAVVNADGTFTYIPNLNFTGTDAFSLRVADGSGGFVIVNIQVVVAPENDAPVVPNYEFTTIEDTILTSRVFATDVDGDPLTYTLQTQAANGVAEVNEDGTFTYTANVNFNGVDEFTVLVSDNQGGTATSIIRIIVIPVDDAPVAPNELFISTLEETPVSSQINAVDPEGLPLVYTIENQPVNGAVIIDNNGFFTYTPNENFSGMDTFAVRITDAGGSFVITKIMITVVPVEQPPAVPNYSITTVQNQPVLGQVVGTDPNGDLLTYRIGVLPENGTVTVNGDGTFIYTPNLDYVGEDRFRVIVEDTTRLTATSIINVTIARANRTPVTNDFTIDTNENTSVSGQIPGVDPDAEPITFSLVGPAFNGTVIVNVDGTFTYTPNPGFTGVDSFAVELRDSSGAAAISVATVNVLSTNIPPIVPDLFIVTEQGTSATGQVLASDPDGDSIVFRTNLQPLNGTVIINSDGIFTYIPNVGYVGQDNFSIIAEDAKGGQGFGSVFVTINQRSNQPFTVLGTTVTTSINEPVDGAIIVDDPDRLIAYYQLGLAPLNGTVSLNQDGTFTYTPEPGFVGEDFFDIIVTDVNGVQAVGTGVIIVIVGTSEIDTMDYEIVGDYNFPINGQLVAVSTAGLPLMYMIQTNPQNGAVTINVDGTYEYVPQLNFFGTDVFSVLIVDTEGNSSISTVVVYIQRPVAQQPIVTDQTVQLIEGDIVSGAIIASDPLGRLLTYTLLGNGASNGEVILNQDGTFIYTPNANFTGTDSFSVLVQNEIGLTATTTVTILVSALLNQIVAQNRVVRTLINQPVDGQIIATDRLARPLTYLLNSSPTYGTAVVNSDGTFLYTPNSEFSGQDAFEVLIVNDQGDEVVSTVTVIVDRPLNTIMVQDMAVQTLQNEIAEGAIVASDSENRPLRFSQNTEPVNGIVTVNPNGTFIYRPNAQFFGIDSFTVLVQNDQGSSAIAIVRVVVEQIQDSIIVEPLTVTGLQGESISGQVIATDTLNRPLTFTALVAPANGTVILNSDGTFIYTPNTGFIGLDSFVVNIANDLGDFLTTVVTISITNPINEIQAQDQEVTVVAGQVIQGIIAARDSQGRPLTYTIAIPPVSGEVVLNSDGTYAYTPNRGFVGRDQFTILIRNSAGQQAFVTITVNVTPSDNVITPNNVMLQTLSNTQVNGIFTATDSQGRPLTYTIRTAPTNGTVVLNAKGGFQYTPRLGFVGRDQFSVFIVDDTGAAASAVATIEVVELPISPPIINDQTFRLNINETITAQVVARDPQNFQLSYEIIDKPRSGVLFIDASTGIITYTPNLNYVGGDSAVVRVTNSEGQSAIATITFIVQRGLTFKCSIIL